MLQCLEYGGLEACRLGLTYHTKARSCVYDLACELLFVDDFNLIIRRQSLSGGPVLHVRSWAMRVRGKALLGNLRTAPAAHRSVTTSAADSSAGTRPLRPTMLSGQVPTFEN